MRPPPGPLWQRHVTTPAVIRTEQARKQRTTVVLPRARHDDPAFTATRGCPCPPTPFPPLASIGRPPPACSTARERAPPRRASRRAYAPRRNRTRCGEPIHAASARSARCPPSRPPPAVHGLHLHSTTTPTDKRPPAPNGGNPTPPHRTTHTPIHPSPCKRPRPRTGGEPRLCSRAAGEQQRAERGEERSRQEATAGKHHHQQHCSSEEGEKKIQSDSCSSPLLPVGASIEPARRGKRPIAALREGERRMEPYGAAKGGGGGGGDAGTGLEGTRRPPQLGFFLPPAAAAVGFGGFAACFSLLGR
jgi:hypothetical protein